MSFTDGLPDLEKDFYYGIIIVLVILYIACAYFGMCLKSSMERNTNPVLANRIKGMGNDNGVFGAGSASNIIYQGANALSAGGMCDDRPGLENCGTSTYDVAKSESFNTRGVGPRFNNTNESILSHYTDAGVAAKGTGASDMAEFLQARQLGANPEYMGGPSIDDILNNAA